MTETYNPLTAMIDMQRRSIEQSRDMLHRTVEQSKQSNAFALDTIESNKQLQATQADVAQTITATTLDSVAATIPGSNATMRNISTAVDDKLDAAEDINAEYWDALQDILEENTQAYETIADQYLEMVDETFDDALETIEAYETDIAAAQDQATE